MAYTIASLDELGEGYGFRKIRKALGVTAFGVNALVFPPNYDGPAHYHDEQDELYFVHRGTATFEFDGDEHLVGEGGLVHVESTTHRRVSNRTDEDLVVFIVGGKDGYVERDGQLVSAEDLAKRQGLRDERADDGHAADAADRSCAAPRRTSATRRSSRACPTRASTATPTASRRRRARALAVGLEEPRSRARRPRRDALLEPLPAPRGVPRHPVRRLRAAHAEPAPAPGRPRVHREPRRGQGGDRRPQPDAAARALPRPDEDRARARGRGLLRGAVTGSDPDAWVDPELEENEAAAMCYTSGTTGHAEGRPLLAPLDVPAHARRRRRQPAGTRHLGAGRDPAGRADVPRERVGLPVSRDDDRREARLPGAAPRPGEPARGLRRRRGHLDGRRADDLARHPRHARRGPRAGTTCRG